MSNNNINVSHLSSPSISVHPPLVCTYEWARSLTVNKNSLNETCKKYFSGVFTCGTERFWCTCPSRHTNKNCVSVLATDSLWLLEVVALWHDGTCINTVGLLYVTVESSEQELRQNSVLLSISWNFLLEVEMRVVSYNFCSPVLLFRGTFCSKWKCVWSIFLLVCASRALVYSN